MENTYLMNAEDIEKKLKLLNDKMKEKNIYGEISLVGGAVMCLCYKSREVTKDIDGIFEPKSLIYECIGDIANELQIPDNWLNDGVKGFLSEKAKFKEHFKFSNLTVNVAEPEYMLAMKCLSARVENTNEIEDLKYLIKLLNLRIYEDVENTVLKYYPANRFLVKTKYLIMEVLESVYS